MTNNSLWHSVEKYNALKNKERKAEAAVNVFCEKDKIMSSLKKIGFLLVAHESGNLSFINFKKERIDEKFYGCRYSKDKGFNFENIIKPTDEEIEAIRKIIEIDEKNINLAKTMKIIK